MKKYYLNLSFVAMIFATVFFSGSCGKKSSDPAPAETPTTPTANVKEVPRDIKTKEPAKDGDGTVRTAPTNVTTNGTTVAVQAPTSNFKTTMTASGQTNLGTLLGTTNARLSSTFDFGWFITIVNFKLKREGEEDRIINLTEEEGGDSLKAVMFFDSENPGIYYQYYYELDKAGTGNDEFWDWGTYAVNKDMTTIAFDFTNNVPESVWDIKFMTNSNIVLRTNLVEDSATYPVTVSMFGFDLQNNGVTHTETALQTKLSESPWYLTSYVSGTATTPTGCPADTSYLFLKGLSYFAGSPVPCQGAFEGYYYLKTVAGKEVMTMYYPEYKDAAGQSIADLKIEADVAVNNGIMTIKYTKSNLYEGYSFNYSSTMPSSNSGTLSRK